MEFCRDRDWPVGGKVLNARVRLVAFDRTEHATELGVCVALGRSLMSRERWWYGWIEINLIFIHFSVGFEFHDENGDPS